MPKQIYIGMLKPTIYTLTNLLTNGSLASNTTGWTINSNYTKTQYTGYVKLALNSNVNTSNTGTVANYQVFTSVSGSTASTKQILYARAEVHGQSSNSSYPRVYLRRYENGSSTASYAPNLLPSDSSVNTTAWTLVSTLAETYDGTNYYSYDRMAFGISTSNTQGDALWIKNIMVINLTAAFGRGNEPSKEWCNEHIPFFDGSTTINKITLTNIVPDGQMDQSSWSGGNYSTTEKFFGTRSQYFPANTTTVQTISTSIMPIVGHKYYGRHYLKTNGNVTAADCRFEWYAGDGPGLNYVFGWNQGNYPDWTMESSIVEIEAVNGSSYQCRSFVVNGTGDVWADGLMIIDLTKAFGAGNEPTKEWCDKHIPNFTDEDYAYPDNSIAIKSKKIYIGVNNIARKVKRGYIGVNGIARRFIWPDLIYGGTATALSSLKDSLDATTVGNYAIFGGGINTSSSTYYKTVDTYTSDLIKGTASDLDAKAGNLTSITFNNYALFAGGNNGAILYPINDGINVYNSSLAKQTSLTLSARRQYLASGKNANYVLFAGGVNTGSNYLATIDAYDSSLTKITSPTNLAAKKYTLASAYTNDYILFGGGSNSSYQSTVDSYTSSLVKGTCVALSEAKAALTGIVHNNYYLFAGGYTGNNVYSSTIDIYDSSLVKGTPLSLSSPRSYLTSEIIDDYVVFIGGKGYSSGNIYYSTVNIFNRSLVSCTSLNLSSARGASGSAAIGEYILVAGGYTGSASVDTVDILKLD